MWRAARAQAQVLARQQHNGRRGLKTHDARSQRGRVAHDANDVAARGALVEQPRDTARARLA